MLVAATNTMRSRLSSHARSQVSCAAACALPSRAVAADSRGALRARCRPLEDRVAQSTRWSTSLAQAQTLVAELREREGPEGLQRRLSRPKQPRLPHDTEVDLVRRVMETIKSGVPQMTDGATTMGVDRYSSPDVLKREAKQLLWGLPQPVAHRSTIPSPGSYVTHDASGLPIILHRDVHDPTRVRAYLNVCRHRGTRLVTEPGRGVKKGSRWVCPYHGWQYRADTGALVKVPDGYGFDGLPETGPASRAARNLTRLRVTDRHGFLWVALGDAHNPPHDARSADDGGLSAADGLDDAFAAEVDAFLGPTVIEDWASLGLDRLALFPDDHGARLKVGADLHEGPHDLLGLSARAGAALPPIPATGGVGEGWFSYGGNWKLMLDLFLETYHLLYNHTKTLYPVFFDNLGLFERVSPAGAPQCHQRNLFVKRTLVDSLADADGNPLPDDHPNWEYGLRTHSNILYHIFPNTLVLVQPDHVSINQMWPRGPDWTALSHATLVGQDDPSLRPEGEGDDEERERSRRYWQKNIDLFVAATREDLILGAGIQDGLSTGANDASGFAFGRYEQSLRWFHEAVVEMADAEQ